MRIFDVQPTTSFGQSTVHESRAEGQNATIKGNTVLACVARAIATVRLFYVLWCGGLAVCLYGVGHRPTHTVRLARLIERWITRLTVYRPGT